MLVYVILARRWGEPETHCYLVGVTASKEAALAVALQEEEWRGGKYQCDILETSVCDTWQGILDYKLIKH